jgi:hypothetical protein
MCQKYLYVSNMLHVLHVLHILPFLHVLRLYKIDYLFQAKFVSRVLHRFDIGVGKQTSRKVE